MLPKKSRLAVLLFWLGLAALAVHALAGIAHVRAPAADGVLEICTAQGIVRIDAATLQPLEAPADAGEQHAAPHCCDLCGASCGGAVVATAEAVHPLATAATALRPTPSADHLAGPADESLTPLVPRGPPTRS